MTFPECITLIKDLILGGAAITGAFVAVRGLSAWRIQLKGKAEYDLARRLLITLFKYRDAINRVREPTMWANEMPAPPDDEAESMSRDQISFYGMSKAYETRWSAVQKERESLYADLLETEALWGTALNEMFEKLFKLEWELFSYIRNYLTISNPETQPARREAMERHIGKKRDVMYDESDGDDDDEFRSEMKILIADIEKYVKPKLTHAGI